MEKINKIILSVIVFLILIGGVFAERPLILLEIQSATDSRVDDLINNDCSIGTYLYGFNSNMSKKCRDDVSGGEGTTYTHLTNFTDDLGHIEDNSSWNESHADTKYLQSYSETDPNLWTTEFNNTGDARWSGGTTYTHLTNFTDDLDYSNKNVNSSNSTTWWNGLTSLVGYATESWVSSQGFITNSVSNLANYYLKSEIYNQTETDNLFNAQDECSEITGCVVGAITSETDPNLWTTEFNNTGDARWSGGTTYTHLTNFTDDLGHIEDNSSWNESYANTLYADISVTGDNSSWNESYADTKYYGEGDQVNFNKLTINSSDNDKIVLNGTQVDPSHTILLGNSKGLRFYDEVSSSNTFVVSNDGNVTATEFFGNLNWSWLQNIPALFDGLFSSLDFTGTTGFSDLVDNDSQLSESQVESFIYDNDNLISSNWKVNSTIEGGLLYLVNNGTTGSSYEIRIDSPNPDIELIETDQTSPAGKFEIAVQGNDLQINSRNDLDSSFETIMEFDQLRQTTGFARLFMNLNVTGNVTASYFIGDGSQLTGVTGDNSSWNESHADTKYLQSYSETDPYWSANYSLYNNSWSTDTDTTYTAGSNLTLTGTQFSANMTSLEDYFDTIYQAIGSVFDGLFTSLDFTGTTGFSDLVDNDTTYSALSEFSDDLNHVEDNSSWNESHADTKYLQSYSETDPNLWTTEFNNTGDARWSGGTSDGNASSICADGEFLNGDGTCDVGFLDADGVDSDTTYTNGTSISLVGNVFSLIGSFFSGSWGDLTGVPSGFADDVDNDSQLSESQVETYINNSNLDFDNKNITGVNCIIFQNGAEVCGV